MVVEAADQSLTESRLITIHWLQVATTHAAFAVLICTKNYPKIHAVRKLIIYSIATIHALTD